MTIASAARAPHTPLGCTGAVTPAPKRRSPILRCQYRDAGLVAFDFDTRRVVQHVAHLGQDPCSLPGSSICSISTGHYRAKA
eukprot:2613702-Rhodomonas_salina.1